ncbi:MAG: zinc ribbon domain-containing protein [Candidatus Sulfotelmatobacter sp.]
MDHSCHKCGQSIEDGKPFCAQCGAPQIRVALPEASTEPVPIDDSGAAIAMPGTQPHLSGLPQSSVSVTSSNLRPCALAAGVAAVLMFLGLNPFVAALGTGFIAVAFSLRRGPVAAVRPATGAKLGAFSGLLLFGISTVLETLAVVILHKSAEIKGEMMEKIQQAASRYPGPQVEPFLQFVRSPNGFAFMMVASLIFGLIAFCLLGALGGAISVVLSGRRGRR